MTLDNEGNLYAAGNGITVYNAARGKVTHMIFLKNGPPIYVLAARTGINCSSLLLRQYIHCACA